MNGLTQFPYGLLIAQHVTESALVKMLEERAEKESKDCFSFVRGLKMVDMKEMSKDIDGVTRNGFLVTFENGKTVWSQYVVGADGSKSSESHVFLPLLISLLSGPVTYLTSMSKIQTRIQLQDLL